MGKGPKIFKLHGENYHLIGSVKPRADEPAKFSQLYIHDTENEVRNRLSALRYVIIKIIESENSLCKMNLRHADLTDVFSTFLLAGLPKTARSEKIWLRLL